MESNEKKAGVKKEVTTAKKAKPFEASYTIPELVDVAKTEFNTSSIIVRAALTKEGKAAYTMKEARQLIDRMKKKEVRV